MWSPTKTPTSAVVRALAVAALGVCAGAVPAWANDDAPGVYDITATVVDAPPCPTGTTGTSCVSLSSASQLSYGAYTVTLKPYTGDNEYYPQVQFQTIVSVQGGSATPKLLPVIGNLVVPTNGSCAVSTTTVTGDTLNCVFSGMSSSTTAQTPSTVFSFTVAAPDSGTSMTLSSATSWTEAPTPTGSVTGFDIGPALTTVTQLNAPLVTNTSYTIQTYLPVPNSTVATGSTPGLPTCAQPWSTIATVPTIDTAYLASLWTSPPPPECAGCAQNLSTLHIPGLFGPSANPPTTPLIITLRRSACTIGDHDGDLFDDLLILKEKIYYEGETLAVPPVVSNTFSQVYPCAITGGPVAATTTTPGRPCISSIKVYTPLNSPSKAWWGTFEWVIHAYDNGSFRN
jgi:hypothetical protein